MKRAEEIRNNIDAVMERIEKAADAASRNINEIELLLATKTRTPEEINIAIEHGYGLIGENRAQELEEKHSDIAKKETIKMPRETHFIGNLQGNKVNEVSAIADCIQTVDRVRIARRINNYCVTNHLKKDIMIQVNSSNEASKHGLAPGELIPFLHSIQEFDALNIRGFMTIGLHSDDEKAVRRGFELLRNLSEKARSQALIPHDATHLSMGMSVDLEWAILEGATIIRVGSDVFGYRDY